MTLDISVALAFGALGAVFSVIAGLTSARLSRAGGPVQAPTDYLLLSTRNIPERRLMWKPAQSTIRRAIPAADVATIAFATSSACFGLAASRPPCDRVTPYLLALGAIVFAFAFAMLWKAHRATAILPAIEALDNWYESWPPAADTEAKRPTQNEITEAFALHSQVAASTLRRYHIWPYT
jgi:hypothetical protein